MAREKINFKKGKTSNDDDRLQKTDDNEKVSDDDDDDDDDGLLVIQKWLKLKQEARKINWKNLSAFK